MARFLFIVDFDHRYDLWTSFHIHLSLYKLDRIQVRYWWRTDKVNRMIFRHVSMSIIEVQLMNMLATRSGMLICRNDPRGFFLFRTKSDVLNRCYFFFFEKLFRMKKQLEQCTFEGKQVGNFWLHFSHFFPRSIYVFSFFFHSLSTISEVTMRIFCFPAISSLTTKLIVVVGYSIFLVRSMRLLSNWIFVHFYFTFF